jgi:hypothetical protein
MAKEEPITVEGKVIETLPNGKKAIAHGGQGTGWMTHFVSVPETGDGIVILTNSQRSWPFFAYILNDWAKWSGFSSIGFGHVITAKGLMWALIGVFLFLVLWQSFRLIHGLISGDRSFAPFSKHSRLLRSIQFGFSILIAGVLLWILSMDYFFLNSVFPIVSGWLWTMLTLAGGILLLSALFPRTTVYRSK